MATSGLAAFECFPPCARQNFSKQKGALKTSVDLLDRLQFSFVIISGRTTETNYLCALSIGYSIETEYELNRPSVISRIMKCN